MHAHTHAQRNTHTLTPPYGLCAPTADTAHNLLHYYYYYGHAQTPGQNNNIHNLHDTGTFAPGMGAGIAEGSFSKQVKYSEPKPVLETVCKTSCIYRTGLEPDSKIR